MKRKTGYGMTKKFKYKGYWWLPNNPDEKVAGILTYTPHESIILELLGNFDSEKTPVETLFEEETEKIIHGFTSDAKEITLMNCHPSGSINFSCRFPIIRHNCQFIVSGKHLERFNQKSFYKAFVTIPELTYWRPPELLKTSIRFTKEDRIKSTSISFESESKIINNTQIDNNTQLIIKEGVNYYGNHFSSKIEQQTHLEILKQSDTSIESFYSDICLYEQFLSLATLRTVKCSQILLYDRTIFQELKNGEKYFRPIEIIYIQRAICESSKAEKHNFLFDYNSIASQYPKVIQKWYADKKEIAPIRTHLIDSIKSKRVFSSIDFLIVIQAIDGFWRRFRDNNYRKINKIPSEEKTRLRTIMNELIKEFDSIHKIRDLDLNVTSVVHSRNYYTHFMNKTETKHALDGWDLYDLTFKLRKILICCVLNFIGFECPEIDRILNGSNNNLL